MNNTEKFLKEWGSMCRIFNRGDKPIYSHTELLDFADKYHKSMLKNNAVETCRDCGSINITESYDLYWCHDCEESFDII